MATQIDSLSGLVLFARIVQYGSLSAAAAHSGMSRSAISKQLTALEARLGVRLLQRSTRSLKLTEAGAEILEEAQRVTEALSSVETLSEQLQGQVRGHLKVSCTSGIGKVHLVPLLKKFSEQYPKVHVQLFLEDRVVDLIDEQMDVAIRLGHLPDSTHVARRLGETSWVVCASPDYLAKHGTPTKPGELLDHDCLSYRNNKTTLSTWMFNSEKGEEYITVDGPLSVNDSASLVEAAELGMGILWADKIVIGNAIEDGRLVPVLENYSLETGYPIYAVYPARRHLSSKTRVFVDFLADQFTSRITM